ncbi:hypothetical protein MY3296_007447 [Beauveria thailandica]
MDVHLNSLNVRFWSRRETILRPVLWSLEDLRLFGCRFGDITTSQLQGHVATPVEDSSAATGPDALRAREALRLQSCRASPFVKEGCMVNILCNDNLYAWCRARPPLRIGKRTIPGAPANTSYSKHTRHNTTYQDIILFNADISTALLDELDDPRLVPQRRTRLVIHRTRMSIEPRKDFLARLVAALSSRADDNAADGEGWGGGEGRGDRADEEGSGRQET